MRPGRVLMNSVVPSGSLRGSPSAGSIFVRSFVVMTVKMPSARSTPSRQFKRQSKVSGASGPRLLSLSSPSFFSGSIIENMPGRRTMLSRPWNTLSMSSMSAMHGVFVCISVHALMRSWLPISARLYT